MPLVQNFTIMMWQFDQTIQCKNIFRCRNLCSCINSRIFLPLHLWDGGHLGMILKFYLFSNFPTLYFFVLLYRFSWVYLPIAYLCFLPSNIVIIKNIGFFGSHSCVTFSKLFNFSSLSFLSWKVEVIILCHSQD